jgi:hypothetical protein
MGLSPTHQRYIWFLKSGDTVNIRLESLFTEDQKISQNTIPAALMTAWEGDLLGGDIIIWGRELLPPEKIVCKKSPMF